MGALGWWGSACRLEVWAWFFLGLHKAFFRELPEPLGKRTVVAIVLAVNVVSFVVVCFPARFALEDVREGEIEESSEEL